MALSAGLGNAGFTPTRIQTDAKVHMALVGTGMKITKIDLNTEAQIPNIDEQKFQEIAENAKKNCPVSQALASVEIGLTAKLV
jgi:osmotically inducible protein OsmC